MSTTKPTPTPIQQTADETQERLMRYMEANTVEDDARREAEREARLAAIFEEFAREGNSPPRRKPKPKAPGARGASEPGKAPAGFLVRPDDGERNVAMNLPLYCIVGARPVRAIATPDGGMRVEALDWKTGELVPEPTWASRILMGYGEVDYVSEGEFEAALAAARARITLAEGR